MTTATRDSAATVGRLLEPVQAGDYPRSPLTDCLLFCGLAGAGGCAMRLRFFATAGLAMAASGLLCAGSVSPAMASSGPGAAGHLRVVSGPSPFAGGCPGAALDNTHVAGDEIEPAIAVNPADRRNLVGTWQQDLGFSSLRAAISSDGRATAARRGGAARFPALPSAPGGTADSASDPWISVGPDGTAYFLGIEVNLRGDLVNLPSAIVASRSHDGGRTWTRPVTVSGFEPVNDTDAITASPTRAGHAYAAWANWDHTFNFQFPSVGEVLPHHRRWCHLVASRCRRPAGSGIR